VVHVLDASRAVGVATTLVSDTIRDDYVTKIAEEYDAVRRAREGKGQSDLVPIEQARANGFAADMALKPAAPDKPGLHVFPDWDLADLAQYIDWTPFFRAWELAGNYPAILDDKVVGESARSLFADAQAMLERIIGEKWLVARGVAGLWPCVRHGDDIVVDPEAVWNPDEMGALELLGLTQNDKLVRLPMLRQQIAKREGRANMCLADFIDVKGDWIGGFAVSIHGIEPHLARFKAAVDDYSDILLKALADRFAEAFAERLHQHVRTELWGYAKGEQLDNQALIREQYRGIRPAPGYPACPEHSLKPILFDMLDAHGNTGATLTESFAMLPTAAVSGFYFGHPQSEYFGVARVGRDQLEDYATRRGVDLPTAERWLRPNLD
jgi:5-methyltetrahydrofolate--homocysteine methyltransferase